MTLENISILQQELKSIYSQTTAEEYLTALHVHLLKCLGFGPRNNFYYFSFVWNVENSFFENRQNRLRIPKEYFIISGLLVHRGM